MTDYAAGDLLRVAMIAAISGFGVFCASYAVAVWRRRNREGANPLIRVGILLCAVGSLAAGALWGIGYMAERSGIVDGSDLFVVHSRGDASLLRLTDRDEAKTGDVVADFLPPGIDAQLAVLDSQIREAELRLDALETRALPVDPILVQRQAQLRSRLDQSRAFGFDLNRSMRDIERDRLSLRTSWTRELGQMQHDLETARQMLESAEAQSSITDAALARGEELRRRGTISVQDLEARQTAAAGPRLDRDRAAGAVRALEARLANMETSFTESETSLSRQLDRLAGDHAGIDLDLTELARELDDVEVLVEADHVRALASLDQDRSGVRGQLATLTAERRRILASNSVTAPFDARVVYRHPSPGLAGDGVALLALSTGNGFTARISLPAGELDMVASAGELRFALPRPLLNRYFTGRYRGVSETPAHDDGRVIAHFDVDLPTEAVTLLGRSGASLDVALRWRPALLDGIPFLAACAAALSGILAMLAGAALPKTPLAGNSTPADAAPVPVQRVVPHLVTVDGVSRVARPHARTPSPPPSIRAMAARFDADLRSGELRSADVTALHRLIEDRGDFLLSAMRAELTIDRDFEAAARSWSERHPGQRLDRLVARLKQVSREAVA